MVGLWSAIIGMAGAFWEATIGAGQVSQDRETRREICGCKIGRGLAWALMLVLYDCVGIQAGRPLAKFASNPSRTVHTVETNAE